MERANPVEGVIQFLNRQPIYASPEKVGAAAKEEFERIALDWNNKYHTEHYESSLFEFTSIRHAVVGYKNYIESDVERRRLFQWHSKFLLVTSGSALVLFLVGQPLTLRHGVPSLCLGAGLSVWGYACEKEEPIHGRQRLKLTQDLLY